MAGQIISTLSNLARPNVAAGPLDLLFRRTDFLNLLRMKGKIAAGVGPSPFKWNVITGSNSSVEVFSEGQTPPNAGRQTYQQASLAAFYVRGTFGTTGHVKDNMAKAGFYDDPFTIERIMMDADVLKKVEDELVGSTADRGIAGIIDATGTYAGISQGTVSQWASEENGSIGTLGVDDLQDLHEELTSASGGGSVPRGAKPTHVLMPPNQLTNYQNTIGTGASTSLYRFTNTTGFDAGIATGGMAFRGMPVMEVSGITSTEIYMLDLEDMQLLEHRGLRIDPIVGNPEEEKYQLSLAVCLKVGHRNWHGKLTGVTA